MSAVLGIVAGPAGFVHAQDEPASDEAAWLELSDLALRLYRQGRVTEATRTAEEALRLAERAFGPGDLMVATSLNNLGLLYKSQPKYQEAAEQMYTRAIEVWETALGFEHPRVAQSMNNLAELYVEQERLTEAEALHKKVLARRESTLGPDHPDVAQSLNNLAELYRLQEWPDAAEPLYQRALEIYEHAAPQHPERLTVLLNYTIMLHAQGSVERAEALLEQAKSLYTGIRRGAAAQPSAEREPPASPPDAGSGTSPSPQP